MLSPTTLLQLAPGVRTRMDAAGHVLLDAPDGTIVDMGPRGYAALSLFVRPVALGEAIERLEGEEHSATDFAPTMNVINVLIEEGALISPGAGGGTASGWADPVEHARMLHDDRRTGDYLAAVAQAVRPGDVVVDIGTGSGVMAIAAARAGARHVYAIEASDIAGVAERVFVANGVQDRVTLIPGWSRQVQLPEPADVLVSEVIGNEPLEEEILETTLDARRRLLKPEARLIPNALTLLARPLLLPDGDARQRAIGPAAIERWRRAVRHRVPAAAGRRDPGPRQHADGGRDGRAVEACRPAGRPRHVDLTSFDEAVVDGAADLVVDTRRARSTRSRSPSAPISTGTSRTRSIPGAGRLELGDLGLGASRRGAGQARSRAARALQPPGARNTPTVSPASSSNQPRADAARSHPLWVMRERRRPAQCEGFHGREENCDGIRSSTHPPPDDDGGRRCRLRDGQEQGQRAGGPGGPAVPGGAAIRGGPAGARRRPRRGWKLRHWTSSRAWPSCTTSGTLTDEEFAAAKAKVLGIVVRR